MLYKIMSELVKMVEEHSKTHDFQWPVTNASKTALLVLNGKEAEPLEIKLKVFK